MRLGSIRDLIGMESVFKDPQAKGQDPVYWVFSELTEEDRWANLTVISAGNYSGEYPKTFGHYHPKEAPNETYHLLSGEGILQFQRRKVKDGQSTADQIDEVFLIRVKPGEEVVITPEWGHSWSNIGKYPLLSFDNWRSGHTPTDYVLMEKYQGMAYYLIEENGEVKAVPNPKYKNLPEPKWVTADEFREEYS